MSNSEKLTLANAYERFLNERDIKETTRYKYKNNQKYLARFLHRDIATIEPQELVVWYNELRFKVGQSLSHQVCRDIKAVLNYSKKLDLIHANPFQVLRLLNPLRRPKREVIRSDKWSLWLRGVLDLRCEAERDLLLFMAHTGCRILDARLLKWANVDLKQKTWTTPDTVSHEPIVLPLSSFACKLLAARKPIDNADDDFVFEGSKVGRPLCLQLRGYKEMCLRLQLPKNPLAIRKSAMTLMLMELQYSELVVKALLCRATANPQMYKTNTEKLRPYIEAYSERLLTLSGFDFKAPNAISMSSSNSSVCEALPC